MFSFSYNTGGKLHFGTFLKILAMNFAMLTSGYLGETKQIDRTVGLITGLFFFFSLFGYIYYKFLSKKPIFDNKIFWAFFTFGYYGYCL